MSEFEGPTHQGEVDATRAIARLPGLDIEIVHRRSPGGDAEQISINLQAVPSFAFGATKSNRSSPSGATLAEFPTGCQSP